MFFWKLSSICIEPMTYIVLYCKTFRSFNLVYIFYLLHMPRFANVDGLYIVTEPMQQHHCPGKHVKYTSHEREHTHTSFHCVLSSRRGTNCVTLYMHHLCNLIFYPRIPNEIIVASDFTSWLDYTFFLQNFLITDI